MTRLALRDLGILAQQVREYDRAKAYLAESIALSREIGTPPGTGVALRHVLIESDETGP